MDYPVLISTPKPVLMDNPALDNPFPVSSSRAGDGRIVVGLLPAGGSGVETIRYQYPLKLISPSPTFQQKSALVFILSYGGGLVGGDKVRLSVLVCSGASLSMVTQGNTKVFKSPSPAVTTRQTLEVQIEEDAALCLLPDPVQPFADSVYEQTQVFKLRGSSSLCLLDWVTQGRVARGEKWDMVKWVGRNELWLQAGGDDPTNDRLLVRDNVVISRDGSASIGLPLKDTMREMSIFGTLVLRGPVLKPVGEFFMAEFATLPRLGSRDFRTKEAQEAEDKNRSEAELWRSRRIDMEKRTGVLWSAAQVRGCVVVKLAAPTVHAGREWIGSMLEREGSIAAFFGDRALMCVR
ncbi:putative urease accessory protein ureD [Escovopsis weberi]|uniref:Putative urease accessory protein ureD n=1 Tax=Escovopsis weberi TaxID=150374 RepID=A0A0M8MVW0_ESCWE|nr:putative urease accessory protein ureD [Escovopsis weberi]